MNVDSATGIPSIDVAQGGTATTPTGAIQSVTTAKAWCNLYTSGGPFIQRGFNVINPHYDTRVTTNDLMVIDFITPMPTAQYCVVAQWDGDLSTVSMPSIATVVIVDKTTTSVRFGLANIGASTYYNMNTVNGNFSIVVYA